MEQQRYNDIFLLYLVCFQIIMSENSRERFMKQALEEARKAFDKQEVPVGAIIVHKDTIIARGSNLTETLKDPTAHAEMQAITSATNWLGGKYLKECSVYVTLEPCAMCAAAIGWSQASELIYGASDEKKGYTKIKGQLLHPKTKVIGGLLENECRELITKFFKAKRTPSGSKNDL